MFWRDQNINIHDPYQYYVFTIYNGPNIIIVCFVIMNYSVYINHYQDDLISISESIEE